MMGLGTQGFVSGNFRSAILGSTPTWGYLGEEGPDSWARLSSEFSSCALGNQQSPIDLLATAKAGPLNLEIDYGATPLKILHNSHTIQINVEVGHSLRLEGVKFELLQFHFHHPSEHHLNGQIYPLEVHFVHQSPTGALAVLGVFLEVGSDTSEYTKIWGHLPTIVKSETLIPGVTLDLARLLPTDSALYRYYGSLTTPPCSESVQWLIFETGIAISAEQVHQFAQIFPRNARPLQALNKRKILRSQT